MKDPKVVKLVEEIKQHLAKMNGIHQQLDKQNVWVDLQKKDNKKGWEIRHLEQRVKY